MSSGELEVDDVGIGEVVVLLHGVPSPPAHFAPLVARLASRWRVLVPHMPGYGRSQPNPALRSLGQRQAALTDALLARGARRVHLVAFSGGATRALSLALEGRLEVRSMFLLSGFCSLSAEERAGFAQFADALDAGADLTPLAGPRFLSPHYAAMPEAVAEVKGWLGAADRATLAGELRELSRDFRDLTGPVGKLSCPIVARHGTLDVAVPIAHAEELVSSAGNAQLQQVEGAGHALLIEDFEGTAAALVQHLAGA